MSVKQINRCMEYESTAIVPCYNCAMHNFISFERIRIDNFKCTQKGKCQICKFEWTEYWYTAEQRQSSHHRQQLSSTSSERRKQKLRHLNAETKMSANQFQDKKKKTIRDH